MKEIDQYLLSNKMNFNHNANLFNNISDESYGEEQVVKDFNKSQSEENSDSEEDEQTNGE